MLCWLPPGTRPTLWFLIRSGFIHALLGFGPTGAYHFLYFEYCLAGLYRRTVRPLGYRNKDEGGFVQIVATDPAHRGVGFAAALLGWQIEQHKRMYPGVPVFLDTAGEYQQKVYGRVGFRELGRHHLGVNVDKQGLRPSGSSTLDQSQRVDSVQIVMMVDCGSK